MVLSRQKVADWLDAYVRAWLSYDAAAIGALFSEDATYAWHPWDAQPIRGRAAIIEAWLADRDKPGTYRGSYSPLAIEGDVVVATGTTQYLRKDGSVTREFYNCWVMRFDEQGQCTAFTEWFMRTPTRELQRPMT
jgi:ketosteroid isomerase-like protein